MLIPPLTKTRTPTPAIRATPATAPTAIPAMAPADREVTPALMVAF